MRTLKTNDIFKMSKILKKMNLKIDMTGKKTKEELGEQIVTAALENLHLAQDEVNDFLGDLAGMTGQEFGELPLEKSAEIIKEFSKQPGLMNFFKLAGL